jgi:hypothetical protein
VTHIAHKFTYTRALSLHATSAEELLANLLVVIPKTPLCHDGIIFRACPGPTRRLTLAACVVGGGAVETPELLVEPVFWFGFIVIDNSGPFLALELIRAPLPVSDPSPSWSSVVKFTLTAPWTFECVRIVL